MVQVPLNLQAQVLLAVTGTGTCVWLQVLAQGLQPSEAAALGLSQWVTELLWGFVSTDWLVWGFAQLQELRV